MRILICFLLVSLSFLSCDTTTVSKSGLDVFIPRKATVILKTNDPKGLKTALQNSDLIHQYAGTALYTFVSQQETLLNAIEPNAETLFCFTKLGRDDYDISLITRMHKDLYRKDSLFAKEANLNDKSINNLGTDAHYLVYDGIFIASSSKILLENVIREAKGQTKEDKLFTRAYATSSENAAATLFVRGSEGATFFKTIFPAATRNPLENSFSWAAADLDIDIKDIRLNGVILAKDSTELRLNLLRRTAPVTNRIAEITPLSATEVSAITYRNWENYKESKADFLKMDPAKIKIVGSELFTTFTEIGLVTLPKGRAIIGISADAIVTTEALVPSDAIRTYRNISIYEYGTKSTGGFSNAFSKAFEPLLNLPAVNTYAQLGDFFIFGESQEVLETIIANYQNKAVLAKSEIFKNTERQLSSASSYLNIKNLTSGAYQKDISEKGKKALKDIALDDYTYAASQLIQEDDYLHYNAVILKNETRNNSNGVTQIASVKLNADLMTSPQLVKNHRTNGMDIVVQDINNTLYLISNSGKVLWQREIDGQVLGEILQVDLYRNGRLQLAFTTPKSFYIIDRTGKDVSPYPLSFNDEITQPLAIFDYDKNRKYRFLIVQNDGILMYNKEAKPVTGFTYTRAGAPVIFPPEHIRMGNKDYIVIPENTGKLNILSRVGATRITVNKTIDFGNTSIFKNGNSFQTYDVNGNEITIGTSGKVTERISNFSSDSKISVVGSSVVGIRENELVIGEKKVKIPYGTYRQPRIATAGSEQYIAITNIEANEVMLYTSNGEALPHFPVYGISRADVGFLERDKSLGFVTQGDANSILIYRVN